MATKTISYYDSQGIVFRHTTDVSVSVPIMPLRSDFFYLLEMISCHNGVICVYIYIHTYIHTHTKADETRLFTALWLHLIFVISFQKMFSYYPFRWLCVACSLKNKTKKLYKSSAEKPAAATFMPSLFIYFFYVTAFSPPLLEHPEVPSVWSKREESVCFSERLEDHHHQGNRHRT